MRKSVEISIMALVLFAVAVMPAYAGVFDNAKAWLTGEVAALVISALTVILAGALGLMFKRIAGTFREAGEFLTILGTALDDSRITRDELAMIIRQGKDIFRVWK